MTPNWTDVSVPTEAGNAPNVENVAPVAMAGECSSPSPSGLTELIESERVELLQVQAMLKCLYEVLLYADDDDSLMHADVANVCARLINDSACRLQKLLMGGAVLSSGHESSPTEVSKSRGLDE